MGSTPPWNLSDFFLEKKKNLYLTPFPYPHPLQKASLIFGQERIDGLVHG
jgi:hypothetical protein